MLHPVATLAVALVAAAADTVPPARPGAAAPPQVAHLDRCPTLAGEVVLDCRLAYRTFGRLAPARDNVVLIPSWYGGRSEDLRSLLGPGALVDTTRWFVVAVDALGNGVSTSPSTSARQPGRRFPRLTVADLVAAEHRLVTEVLGIPRLHAVLGFSLGAFQALEWGVRHPALVDRVVAVQGIARVGAYEHHAYRTMLHLLDLAQRAGLAPDSVALVQDGLWRTVRATPAYEADVPLDSLDAAVRRAVRQRLARIHPEDDRLQLQTILSQDVSRSTGGDLARAAARLHGRLLVIFSPDDRITSAEGVRDFARLAGADTIVLRNRCGHFAYRCDSTVAPRVRAFLAGALPRAAAAGAAPSTPHAGALVMSATTATTAAASTASTAPAAPIVAPADAPRFADAHLKSGLRLRYAEAGDPAGAPVILLHGVTDSWFSFSRVLPALAPHGRLIAVDQRGHGRSDRPAGDYTPPVLARDVVELMDALGIARAAIVGHSMGSLVAQHVAAAAPERVERLVLVGSAADIRTDGVRELAQALADLPDPIPDAFARDFQLGTLHLPVPPDFLEVVVAESRSVPAPVWRALFAGMLRPDAVAPLARITAPTLLLWGEHDAIFGRADQDALRAAIPGAELLVYPETGHTPHWERPDRFAADLGAFLRRDGR